MGNGASFLNIDLTQVTQLLSQAESTLGAQGTVELQGLDPRDLLGDFGSALKGLQEFGVSPDDLKNSVVDGLARLDQLVQLESLPALGEVVQGLQRLVGLLQDAADRFGIDSGDLDLNQLLPEISNLDEFFDDLIEKALDTIVPQVPSEVGAAVETIRILAEGDPPNGRELARLLSPLMLGLKLGSLQALAGRIEDFFQGVAAAGGDLSPIEAEIQRLTVEIRAVAAALEDPESDAVFLSARIASIRGGIGLLVHNALPGAAAALSADLAKLRPVDLGQALSPLLKPLLTSTRSLPFNLEEDLMTPIRNLCSHIDSLTPELLDEHFDEVREELEGFAEGTGIELLPEAVDDLFDLVVDTMREVPVQRLRDDLIDALDAIEARIREFGSFQAPAAITDKVREFEARIEAVDPMAVQQKIAEFSSQIDALADSLPIEAIGQEIQNLNAAAGSAIEQFADSLDALSRKVDELATRVETIDLSQASSASIELVSDIRRTVEEAVGSEDVPEAAKVAIGAAAGGLKKIDFTAEIRAPFNLALDQIDVSVVTQPLEPVTAQVREALSKITPRALVDELEGPFDQLLFEMGKLRPQALTAGLSAEFQQLVSSLEELRPQNLVAPLQEEFEGLTARLREVLDPAPLIAPLNALYEKLQELLEFLDMEKILGKILQKTAGIPTQVGQRLQETLQKRVGAASDLPETDPTDDLFEWGDFLRPLAAIVLQVRSKIQGLAETILGEAFETLQKPLQELVGLADDAGALASRTADAVEGRFAVVDLLADSGPGEELRLALNELEGAVASSSASFSGQAAVEVNGHLAAMQVDLEAQALLEIRGQAEARIDELTIGLSAPGLANDLRLLGERLGDLVPDELLAPDAAAGVSERIASFFDVIDFTALADELDQCGATVRAKLEGFARRIAEHLVRIWNVIFEAVEPLTPAGMIGRIQAGMQRVRDEFAVLDPSVFEEELREIVDALIDALEVFSPASLASQLNGVFDPLKAKIEQLDPAVLLGDLSPIETAIGRFESLRPSLVLAPLLDATSQLEKALDGLLAIDFGATLEAAVENIKAQLDEAVSEVEAEIQALLSFLTAQAGGGGSVGVSVSV